MIISMLYRTTRALLSVPAVLLRRDTAKEAEILVLRHENVVCCGGNSAVRSATSSPTGYGWPCCRR
ncbi:hypothetical protein [Streptomyces violens]|uniref:hypothetical protein n=1 Tax=Streptomyces violens TaxID=66377 RepID=UPI0004C03B8C